MTDEERKARIEYLDNQITGAAEHGKGTDYLKSLIDEKNDLIKEESKDANVKEDMDMEK